MKAFLRYFCVLVAVAMVGAFATSCEKVENNKESFEAGSIYGTWSQTNSSGTLITIAFNKNSTGYVNYAYPNGDSSRENFTFDYHQDNRYLQVLETSCQLCGYYDVAVSAKRLELMGYNYYVGDDVWYVFTR